LKKAIIKAAGDEVETAYNTEYKNNSNAILISTPPGVLPCKRIFFVKWQPDKDEAKLRQSLIDLIWIIVQNVMAYKFTSLAFPAIGCGKHGCSVDIVVKTLVKEMKNQLTMRDLPLTVKFVIQSDQQNIYDEFCKQVLATQNGIVKIFLFFYLVAVYIEKIIYAKNYPELIKSCSGTD
jgi:O-acetyl-ADP-ribose deacetylase (regulator of RNase III)